MKIRRMTATYGKLNHQSLVLADGLNLIHAPNETGKSTWASFLRTMLYGLNTRDRSPLADKIRYAPWSGIAMEGIMEVEAGGRELTLARRTSRRTTPMGSFEATYTGTATAVAELSGTQCGDILLGIPREVYERSAFIGQSAMAIDQVGSLERRIASLITTGEEGTSFSEANDRLKKQMTRRRYHRNGLLPAIEGELADISVQLDQIDALYRELEELQSLLPALEEQEKQCRNALARSRQSSLLEARRKYIQLLHQSEEARELLNRCETEAAGLPGRTGLITLKSAAGSVVVNQMAKKRAADQLALRKQEAAVAAKALMPFTQFRDMTAEAALKLAENDCQQWLTLQKRRKQGRYLIAGGIAAAAVIAAVLAFQLLPLRPGALTLILPAALAAAGLVLSRSGRQAAALAVLYNTDTGENFAAYARQYGTLYNVYLQQKQAETEALSRLDGLTTAIDSSIEQILAGVRVFSPEVTDLNNAVAAIDRAVARTERLEQARQNWDQLRIRCETLESTLSGATLPDEDDDLPLPSASPEELQAEHERLTAQLERARHDLAHIQGRLRSAGDRAELIARQQELQRQLDLGNLEYHAIATAMAELENANTDLQARFSPALGAEAARIFAKLTGGKYHKVLLDRELSAQAEAEGDLLPHPAGQLSAGAADQLYLAVRLAICRMVLPAETPAPLVLDDALANFDDERMALALEVLREEAKSRQILLFTCQERELRWAEGKEDIHCIRLSQA